MLHDCSAIVTRKVFSENTHLSEPEVQRRLTEAFELDRLILIPNEAGDIWGHADGMVSWAGPDHVLMNDYRKIDRQFHRNLKHILTRSGVAVTEIPYAPDLNPAEVPSAKGSYVNLLALPEVVLLPIYGIVEDDEAFNLIKSIFTGRQIVTVNTSGLALEGGSVHCVSWETQ